MAPTFISITGRQTIGSLPLLLVCPFRIFVALRLLDRLVYVVLSLGRDLAHRLVAEVDPPLDDLLQPVQLRNHAVDAFRVGHDHARVNEVVEHDFLERLDAQGKILGIDVLYRGQARTRRHRARGRVATTLAHGARAGLLASALEAGGWRHLYGRSVSRGGEEGEFRTRSRERLRGIIRMSFGLPYVSVSRALGVASWYVRSDKMVMDFEMEMSGLMDGGRRVRQAFEVMMWLDGLSMWLRTCVAVHLHLFLAATMLKRSSIHESFHRKDRANKTAMNKTRALYRINAIDFSDKEDIPSISLLGILIETST